MAQSDGAILVRGRGATGKGAVRKSAPPFFRFRGVDWGQRAVGVA